MEGYKPSEEEVKKAEDTMTEKQESLTATREKQAEALKELGVSGYLYSGSDRDGGYTVEGKLNGFDVKFEKDRWKTPMFARINGVRVRPDEKAHELIDKYFDLAISGSQERMDILKAKGEIEDFDADEKVKQALSELL